MDQSRASTRYYCFEEVLWETPAFAPLARRQPMAHLHLLAGLVWAREGSGRCPEIKARAKNDTSIYWNHTHTIHLAPKHRSVGGLLHELAHALGKHDKLTHGPAFQARCLRLYKTYGDWSGDVASKECA